MSKFQGVDYYQVDALLTEDEILVRNTVREFVEERIIPVIEKHNRESTFPADLIAPMAELGLLGATANLTFPTLSVGSVVAVLLETLKNEVSVPLGDT